MTGTRPSINGASVSWITRCKRREVSKENADLRLDAVADAFFQGIRRGRSPPELGSAHAYVKSVLDQRYHRGYADYSERIDKYLELSTSIELENASKLLHEDPDEASWEPASSRAIPGTSTRGTPVPLEKDFPEASPQSSREQP